MASKTSFTGSVEAFTHYPIGVWAKNWLLCDGRLLAIADYPELYNIIGTQFGGDGINNFAIPNLKERVVVGTGKSPGLTERSLGEFGGANMVQLTEQEMPAHRHSVICNKNNANEEQPGGNFPAKIHHVETNEIKYTYTNNKSTCKMAPDMLKSTTNCQPHSNLQPVLILQFYICVYGQDPYYQG